MSSLTETPIETRRPRCLALPCPDWLPPELPCTLPSAALPCLAAASTALYAAQRPTTLPCPACKRAALPPLASRCPAQRTVSALLPNVPCTPSCPTGSHCLRAPALPRAYRQLPLSPAHAPTGATATAPTTAAIAVATLNLAPLLLTDTAYHGPYHCHTLGGGASRARLRKPLSPQQRREWAVRWDATPGGTCESTPAGSAASRRGGSGGGQ
ncbi:unnamed protein product [Closterium sp. NIES-54]